MKFIVIITYLSLLFLIEPVIGQNLTHIVPPSPIAAQYEKYFDYPVDHNTGTASVEVPLYTVKTKTGIQIPIKLSYHTAGVKPSDPDLPIGLGWVIQPGARISRKIVGHPDERYPKMTYTEYPTLLDFENMEYTEVPIPSSGRTTTYDAEYDIFTYQTGTGVNGRFIIEKQGSDYIAKPLDLTRHKIKLHTIVVISSTVIDFIEISDDMGTLYRFGKGMTSYSGDNTTESNLNATTGWLLTDIISADKQDVVNLKWQNIRNNSSEYYKQTGVQDLISVTDKWHPYQSTPADATFLQIGYSTDPNGVRSSPLTESFNKMCVIAGIKYANEEVKFNYTTGLPTVATNMEVYYGIQKLKQITFHKSTFANSFTRLDSLSFIDSGNQTINRYRFGYYESTQWPDALTRGIDFWGYYNAQANTNLVPDFSYLIEDIDSWHYPFYQTFTTTNRDPNLSATQACILNSITYPTGGKTTYEYELNQIYDASLSLTYPGGGLRIAKITHWTTNSDIAETRTFKYGINESGYGDGIPMTADLFATATEENSKFYIYDGIGGVVFGKVSFRKRIFTGNPSSTTYTQDYPSVTYRQVTEYIGDTSTNAGKILYEYSREQYNIRTLPYSRVSYTFMDRAWDKPRLTKTSYFKHDLSGYTKISSDATSYRVTEPDTVRSWLIRRFANFYTYYTAGTLPGDPQDFEADISFYFPDLLGVFDTSPLTTIRGIMAPDTLTHVEYTPSGNITTTKVYGYSNDLLYTRNITNSKSNGETNISAFTYPIDYVSTQPYTMMVDSNIVAPVIEQSTYKNDLTSGNFLQLTKTDYAFWDNGIVTTTPNNHIYPEKVWSKKASLSNPYELRLLYKSYGNSGNVQEVNENGAASPTSYIWGYNNQYPVIEVKNATYQDLVTALTQTVIDNLNDPDVTDTYVRNAGATARAALPNALITTYTYKPLVGITSMTDPKGNTTYYEYDPYQRLINIKDKDGNIVKHLDYNYAQ